MISSLSTFSRLWAPLFLLVLSSCHPYTKEVPTGKPLSVDNVYVDPSYDIAGITNVFLLPIDNSMEERSVQEYMPRFSSSILRSFGKYNYFNLQMDKKYRLQAGEVINLNTGRVERVKLGALGQSYNADAILQVAISEFRAFIPMHLHLKAALLDANTGQRIWTFDHVFDTGNANTTNAMRLWWNSNRAGNQSWQRFNLEKGQPSFFLDFAFGSMAKSLQERQSRNVVAIRALEKWQKEQTEEIEKNQQLTVE